MAPRFHSEQLVGTVETTVTYVLEQRRVNVIDHEIKSPGGRCPMERSYLYVPTPQALRISKEFAEDVHEENLQRHLKVEEEFSLARRASQEKLEEKRKENRERDKERRRRNVEQYGTAKKPRLLDSKTEPGAVLTPPVAEALARITCAGGRN